MEGYDSRLTTHTTTPSRDILPNMSKKKLKKIKPAATPGVLTPVGAELPGRQLIDWPAIARAVRADPSQWHKLDGHPAGVTSTIVKRARLKAFEPAGSFDAADRGGDLYLRFVGEPITPWLPWESSIAEFPDLPRHPIDAPEIE